MADLRFSIAERGKAQIKIPSAGRDIYVLDHETVKATVDDLHSASGQNNWALLGYQQDTDDSLILLGSGDDGIDGLTKLLQDDIAAYGLVKIVDVVDGIPTNRWALVVWMGTRVPGMRKAKISTNRAAVNSIVGHYNVEILADNLNEITQEIITQRIGDASGSRIRVMEANKSAARPAETAKSGGGMSRWGSETKSDRSVMLEDEAGVESLLQDVRSDQNATNWCLLTYKGVNKLVVAGSGSGGVEEMVQAIKPDGAFYGLVNIEDQIDQSKVTRFVHIYFIGERVSPMVKGRLATHLGRVEEIFTPYHVKVSGTEVSEVGQDVIEKRLDALKGSRAK